MSPDPNTAVAPMIPEAAHQQVAQLNATYQMATSFYPSLNPKLIQLSGMFSPAEQAQIAWIARDPNVRQLLDNYENQRMEALMNPKEQLGMWGDGYIGTPSNHDAYEFSLAVHQSLNAAEANIFGAAAMEAGNQLHPGDLEMAAKFASIFATYGDLGISLGEAIHAEHENSGYRPGSPGMEQYAPGPKEDESENPFEATFTKSTPEGTNSYNPYATEGESPESGEGEDPESAEEGDESGHVDGGVPMGVEDEGSQDQIQPDSNRDNVSSDEPNQSFPKDDGPNQSLPEEPNASYPEDPVPIQAAPQQPIQSSPHDNFEESSEEPNASFPEDPISSQDSAPRQSFTPQSPPNQNFTPEPIESSPAPPSPIQSEPAEPISSEPPETQQSNAPAFDPA